WFSAILVGAIYPDADTPIGSARFIPLAIVTALVGGLLDSLLGATVQGIYRCERCGVETERRVHRCGYATTPVRGWTYLNNDRVNLLAIMAGAAVGWLLGG